MFYKLHLIKISIGCNWAKISVIKNKWYKFKIWNDILKTSSKKGEKNLLNKLLLKMY